MRDPTAPGNFRIVLQGNAAQDKVFRILATEQLTKYDYERIKKHIDVQMNALKYISTDSQGD